MLFSNNWRSGRHVGFIHALVPSTSLFVTPGKHPRKMAEEHTHLVNPLSIARAQNTNESSNTTNGNLGTDETDLEASRNSSPHQAKLRRVHVVWDVFAVIFIILTFVADIASDVVVSVRYFLDGSYLWFLLTVVFVISSSIVVQIFSACWFYEDSEDQTSATYLLHLCQLGTIVR